MGILLSEGRWICARLAAEALQVGGDGQLAALLAREGREVVDVPADQANRLLFEDSSFDTVVLADGVAEMASREGAVAEAARVLRPGGRLIVAFPHGGGESEGAGPSLGALLDELKGFSIGEIEVRSGCLFLLAKRGRGRQTDVWRRALGAVESQLLQRAQEQAALTASFEELQNRGQLAESALADARAQVERLETAVAAATHERDREREAARLARAGVSQLEQRLEQTEHRRESELAQSESELAQRESELAQRESELAKSESELRAARGRLEAREQELEKLRPEVVSLRERDRAAGRAAGAREAELRQLRAELGQAERRAATAEARLAKSHQRAEHFRRSLVALREGRGYRLMRVLWRLRRPFHRAQRDRPEPVAAADDEPGPPAVDVKPRRPRRPRRAGDRLRVAAVLDEMSAACFAPECELTLLTRERWQEELEECQPDLLLVESAWNGNGGQWQYRIARYPRPDLAGLPALRALLEGCRERGIPTAFWNKEDPVHFERFSEAAALFDHVFTTDARCVERYGALPGESTVTPLPFAAQPRIHNPTAVVDERSASPCFAGAWYRDRHADRRRALEALLDAARPYGLVIYDRRFGTDEDAFGFPERFQPHVLGRLPYERVLDVYKSHRVFLNANSVADSPTMCSRRVFELAACDTPILSTPATALRELFGEGTIAEAEERAGAAEALEGLLGDAAERRRRARAARRVVFAKHTYADRLATIAEAVGLDAGSLRRRQFARSGDSPNGASGRYPWLLVVQPGVELSGAALADLEAAAAFATADVIGASPSQNGAGPVEHRYTDEIDPRALLVRRAVVEERGRLVGSPNEIAATLRKWADSGVRLYAADADLVVGRSALQASQGAC